MPTATATQARWTKGTFRLPCHGTDTTMDFPGYRWRNVILFRKFDRWTMLHGPTMLGFGASWSKLGDAKAAVHAIDAECDLSRADGDLGADRDAHRELLTAVRKYRQFP